MFTRMDQSTKEEWDHIYNEHLRMSLICQKE